MILVTGATGQFGASAIESLLKKGVNPSTIAALVRNPEKAIDLKENGIELRKGDYTNYSSLVEAFKGVDKLLFVSGSEIETRLEQHTNVVKAAKEVGVGHIFYTSFLRKDEIEESAIAFLQDTHVTSEGLIKESGIPYTILQNSLYMDMIPMFIGEKVAENGLIYLPAGEGKSNSVLRSELAEAAAYVLTSSGHENKIYPLTNAEAVSYQNIAAELTAILGKEIKYQSPSVEEFKSTLEKMEVPGEYIGLFTAFSVARANGELEYYNDTLEKFLGRKPTTAKEFLSSVY